MRNLVCLTEEQSAEEMLKAVLPRLVPGIKTHFRHFEGKSDLEEHVETIIRGWLEPNSCFLVMRDKDAGDCREVKNRLLQKVANTGKSELTCIRIACHELESFYLGDLEAVEDGLGLNRLSNKQNSRKFRDPDRLANASQELKRLTNDKYSKVQGSRDIAPYLSLDGSNKSHSFNVLIGGVKKLLNETQHPHPNA